MFKCSSCERLFKTKRGRVTHTLSCPANPDRNLKYIESKKANARSRPPRIWTDAQRAQHRISMRNAVKKHPESYLGRWRRQSVRYKGIAYDSSWEVFVKKYFDRFDVKSLRKFKRTFSYYWNGSDRVYKPDFFLPEYRLYVEVKGMVTDRDIAKWKQFATDRRLLILTRKSLRRIISGSALGLKSKIETYPDNVLLDGLPIDYNMLSVRHVIEVTKKDRLSREERGRILRDADKPCISCGRHHTGQYHAGHYMSRGARPELAYEPLNCHKQCSPCNTHLSGNLALYRQSLVREIGLQQVEWLEGPHDPKHYTVDDLKAIKAKYTALARELEKQIS